LPENPRDRQKLLALDVVGQYHGLEAAEAAQKAALELIGGGTAQGNAVREFSLAEIQFPAKLFYLVSASGLCKTSSEARRQIQGGAVKLEGDRLDQADLSFDSPDELYGKVLQLGKKNFVRLVP